MPVVINGTTGINTPGQTTAGEQIVQRADTNDLLRLSRTGSSAGEGYLYSNANEIFGVKDTGTTYPFLLKRGAPGNSFTLDSSGRVITPNQTAFIAGIASGSDASYTTGQFLAFNTTNLNIGSAFNTSTNKFTAPVAGLYQFTYGLYLTNSGGATANMQACINVNGSYPGFAGSDAYGVMTATPNSTGTIEFTTTVLLYLSANDVVGVSNRSSNVLRVYQGHTFFTGCLLG